SFKTDSEKKLEEERAIMEAIVQQKLLASDRELVKGIIYTKLIKMILAGRDMNGITFTGSDKILAFSLSLLMFALKEEYKLPLLKEKVKYVKQEAKIVYLLECLQMMPPPILIFAKNKNDVDDIHEYLLVKGVEAVAIHGAFKEYKKNVLVVSDVASKCLDFLDIQYVINYDMLKKLKIM
ncbi:18044_t:CDS:2, partial [Funneliformis geosporum]